jgi:ubiquinone biosynthesis protein UbiJ
VGAALDSVAVKLINRVLADYPLAREQLAAHAGKIIDAHVGPLSWRLRVTADGGVEIVGEGRDDSPDATFHVPPFLLPRLAKKDESAFREVVFTGDSEFVALLSTIAREIEWDIEEDLSRIIGDIAAHRIVDTAKQARVWRKDASLRFTENVAEYLTEEKRAFITSTDLESFTRGNEMLRDELARLEARLELLSVNANAA